MSNRSPPGAPGSPGKPTRPAARSCLVLCLSLLIVVIDNTVFSTPPCPPWPGSCTPAPAACNGSPTPSASPSPPLLVTAGTLGDRFGRRQALVGGLALYAIGSVGAALASGTGALIVWRVVMGAAAAFVMPATLSILNAVFPAEERAQAIAAWSAVAGVAVVIGPTLGGFLLSHFAWGSVFWVNVPLVAVALAAVAAVVPEIAARPAHGGPSHGGIDLVGMFAV